MEQSRPIFTVAIPTLDRGRRALTAVRQALSEDTTPGLLEILVLDNASTVDADCYREIAEISDPRLRYIKKDALQSYQSQLLELLELARGENLLFLSDEDTLDISMLKVIAQRQAKERCAVLYPGRRKLQESTGIEAEFSHCYYLSTFVLDISEPEQVQAVLRHFPRGEESHQCVTYPHKVIALLMQLVSPKPVDIINGSFHKMGPLESCQTAREKKLRQINDPNLTYRYRTKDGSLELTLDWISLFQRFEPLLRARYAPEKNGFIVDKVIKRDLAMAAAATLLEPEPLEGLRFLEQEAEGLFSAAVALSGKYPSVFGRLEPSLLRRDLQYWIGDTKNYIDCGLSHLPKMQEGLHEGYPLILYGAGYVGRAIYQYRHLLDREIFCFCDRNGGGKDTSSNHPLLAIRPDTLKTVPVPFDIVITTNSNRIATSILEDLSAIGITKNITTPFLDYRRVVITGGTGVVGRALVDCLLKEKIEVLLLLRNAESRQHTFPDSPLLTLVECPLEALSSYQGDGSSWDAVFHLGWSNTHSAAQEDSALQEENIDFTLEAVRLAKRLGCHSFIGAGSQAEYGPVDGAVTEETPTAPITAYGVAKLRAGNESRSLCGELGLRHCWARIFSVYGPHDRPDAMLPTAIRRLLAGEEMAFTPLTQPWNYLYVKDAAKALFLIAEYGKDGRIYNVADSENRPLSEYVEVLFSALNKEPAGIGALPYPPGGARGMQADSSRILLEACFKPTVPFSEGIAATIQWYREQKKG